MIIRIITIIFVIGVAIEIFSTTDFSSFSQFNDNQNVTSALNDGLKGFADTLPAFIMILGVLGMMIGILIIVARAINPLIDSDVSDEPEPESEKEIPHSQTYEEYVEERLRIERAMRWNWLTKYW